MLVNYGDNRICLALLYNLGLRKTSFSLHLHSMSDNTLLRGLQIKAIAQREVGHMLVFDLLFIYILLTTSNLL